MISICMWVLNELPLHSANNILIHALPLSIFPEHIIQQYHLRKKSKSRCVYVENWSSIYRHPQAVVLANKALKENLAPRGYFEVAHTTWLWKHITHPIVFSLVVDNFGVKYVDRSNADHLVTALNHQYELSEYWNGGVYWGITLEWNYDNDWTKIFLTYWC